jgi:hypothetical protein
MSMGGTILHSNAYGKHFIGRRRVAPPSTATPGRWAQAHRVNVLKLDFIHYRASRIPRATAPKKDLINTAVMTGSWARRMISTRKHHIFSDQTLETRRFTDVKVNSKECSDDRQLQTQIYLRLCQRHSEFGNAAGCVKWPTLNARVPQLAFRLETLAPFSLSLRGSAWGPLLLPCNYGIIVHDCKDEFKGGPQESCFTLLPSPELVLHPHPPGAGRFFRCLKAVVD